MLIKYYHSTTRSSPKVSGFVSLTLAVRKCIFGSPSNLTDLLHYLLLISETIQVPGVTLSPNRIILQALSPEIYFKPTYRRAYCDCWDYESGCLQMYFSLSSLLAQILRGLSGLDKLAIFTIKANSDRVERWEMQRDVTSDPRLPRYPGCLLPSRSAILVIALVSSAPPPPRHLATSLVGHQGRPLIGCWAGWCYLSGWEEREEVRL